MKGASLNSKARASKSTIAKIQIWLNTGPVSKCQNVKIPTLNSKSTLAKIQNTGPVYCRWIWFHDFANVKVSPPPLYIALHFIYYIYLYIALYIIYYIYLYIALYIIYYIYLYITLYIIYYIFYVFIYCLLALA